MPQREQPTQEPMGAINFSFEAKTTLDSIQRSKLGKGGS
jgi:hypothetical protein